MEREQYEIMHRREDRHWWYAGMRRAALALLAAELRGAVLPRILDAGCGTGGTTLRLRQFGTVYGVDYAAEGLRLAADRGLAGKLSQGTVEALPFRSATFDAATSFEVLYHQGIGSDVQALSELRRVLKPGGLLLLRLPAHDWLRGEHDRLVHTRHRYSLAEVKRKLHSGGFAVQQSSWANATLFLPAAAKRLLEPVLTRGRDSAAAGEPDLWQPPAALNAVLEQCIALEGWAFARRLRLPFGLSVIALARAA